MDRTYIAMVLLALLVLFVISFFSFSGEEYRTVGRFVSPTVLNVYVVLSTMVILGIFLYMIMRQ